MGLLASGAAAATVANTQSSSHSIAALVAQAMHNLRELLLRAQPERPPATEVSAAALAAALHASTAQLERAMRTNSAIHPLLVCLAPLVTAGYLIRRFGWDHLGWVSVETFKSGLAALRQSIEHRLQPIHATVTRTDAALIKVESDVQQIHATVESIEERMVSIENNAARSAAGVEFLCQFVSTSAMAQDSSPSTAAGLPYVGDEARRIPDYVRAALTPVPFSPT